MTYDCFTFFNELDLLDLRLHEHDDFIDKFIILEGDRTFPGKKYDSIYLKNQDRFAWAKDKIIHRIAPLKENPKDRWENERIQREYWAEVYKELNDNDLILQGCVDELYRKETIVNLPETPTMLVLDNFYYFLNGKDVGTPQFPCPVAFYKKDIDRDTHHMWHDLYFEESFTFNAGWHFSFLGGVEKIITKLENFAHSEFDNNYHKNKDRLRIAMETGTDPFEREDHKLEYVPIDSTFPRYLQEHKKEFNHIIWR